MLRNTALTLILLLLLPLTSGQDRSFPRITSGISKTWKTQFHISTDSLIRIGAELEKASKQLNVPTKVVFRVVRSDDRFYETTDVDHVINDPNGPGREITALTIELRIAEPSKVRDPWESASYVWLITNSTDSKKTQLTVRHEDRTWALMTADALVAQIDRLEPAARLSKAAPWLSILLASATLWFVHRTLKLNFSDRRAVRFSIDFLEVASFAAIAVLIMAVIAGENSSTFQLMFGPESAYRWGEANKALVDRETIRANVFWAVLIAVPLSILTGLALELFKRKRSAD